MTAIGYGLTPAVTMLLSLIFRYEKLTANKLSEYLCCWHDGVFRDHSYVPCFGCLPRSGDSVRDPFWRLVCPLAWAMEAGVYCTVLSVYSSWVHVSLFSNKLCEPHNMAA